MQKQMMEGSIEALASAWARIAEEAEFPTDCEGTPSPEVHRASKLIQEQIREHIVATKDVFLYGLLHLLGQASLRMEQVLWPDEYERMARETEEALQEADNPDTKWHSQEDVKAADQQNISRGETFRHDR